VTEETKPADAAEPAVPGEVLADRVRLYYAILVIVGIFVTFLGLGFLSLMAVPLAHVIAGKHTDFTLTVSFSVSAVFTVTTAISSGCAVVQTRRLGHHKNRAKDLENRLKRAQARVAELEKQDGGS
jgi:hypothetical protein